MKKLVLVLLAGLLLTPSEVFADKFNNKKVFPMGAPARNPEQNSIDLFLDENTGDLTITPNYNIIGLNITLERNGVTYIDTIVALGAGQSYTDSLAGYDEGTYILTLSTSDGIIAQYEITVEAD